MNVVIGNHYQSTLGGAESYTRTLLKALKKLGHNVMVTSFDTIDYDRYEGFEPDFMIIAHKNFIKELRKKLPDIPLIQVCHGIFPKEEQPSKEANYHVAISTEVQRHLHERGFKCHQLNQPIDTELFAPAVKIEHPFKIVNTSQTTEGHVMIETALRNSKFRNYELKWINKFMRSTAHPYLHLRDANICVGLGRSALEGMACGCETLIFDKRAYVSEPYCDGWVTEKNTDELIRHNFSGRYSKEIATVEKLTAYFNKIYNKHGMRNIYNLQNSEYVQKNHDYLNIANAYIKIATEKFGLAPENN